MKQSVVSWLVSHDRLLLHVGFSSAIAVGENKDQEPQNVNIQLDSASLRNCSAFVCPEIVRRLELDPQAQVLGVKNASDIGLATLFQLDLWSCAAIIYELVLEEPMTSCSGKKLNREGTDAMMQWRGLCSRQRAKLLQGSKNMKLLDLMDWLTDPISDARPHTASEALAHGYFKPEGDVRLNQMVDAVRIQISELGVEEGHGPKVMIINAPCDSHLALNMAMELAPHVAQLEFSCPAVSGDDKMTLEEKMEATNLYVIIVSAAYLESRVSAYELKLAGGAEKQVLTINVDIPPSDWPPTTLSQVDYAAVTIDQLIRNVNLEEALTSSSRALQPLEIDAADRRWLETLQTAKQDTDNVVNELESTKANATRLQEDVQKSEQLVLEKVATIESLQSEVKNLAEMCESESTKVRNGRRVCMRSVWMQAHTALQPVGHSSLFF